MYPAQRNYLCQAFKNILGTPGVESFIYHRLLDHSDEIRQGLALGLWSSKTSFKPAWELFALANRKGVNANYPSCGFELIDSNLDLWASKELLFKGFFSWCFFPLK